VKWFSRLFRTEILRAEPPALPAGISGQGMILFENTSDVIAAESCLKKNGLPVRVMGPPPELRTGCDMVVEFPLMVELKVSETLAQARIHFIRIVPVQDVLLEPVSLYQVKELGEFLMVRAANMKITVRKSDRQIVNVSGGGCPDVPYLAENLVGKTLYDAPEPRTMGKTLCGYALQLAFEEIKRQCPG
jgi:hypothetical protein